MIHVGTYLLIVRVLFVWAVASSLENYRKQSWSRKKI